MYSNPQPKYHYTVIGGKILQTAFSSQNAIVETMQKLN